MLSVYSDATTTTTYLRFVTRMMACFCQLHTYIRSTAKCLLELYSLFYSSETLQVGTLYTWTTNNKSPMLYLHPPSTLTDVEASGEINDRNAIDKGPSEIPLTRLESVNLFPLIVIYFGGIGTLCNLILPPPAFAFPHPG